MEKVFLNLFNMSISAGWVILAVVVLRFLLKRAPKNISVLLWGAVGLRLISPFTIESVLSLIPSARTLAPEALYDRSPELTTGIPAVNEVVNPVFTESFAVKEFGSVNPLQVAVFVAANIWVLGMIAMGLYGIISYLRLRRKVSASVRLRENIRLSDHVPAPFILGWIRPRIYLPSGMQEDLHESVIAHERAHIKRGDHWIKLVGFVLLCVYWFQPLVWLAYILLCRDIELACDERVIHQMDTAQKKDYTEALLACGMKKHRVAACPLAFGEVGVKQRIKAVLDYKKPTLWIVLAAAVALVIVVVCFLTNPKTETAGLHEEFAYEIDVAEYKAPVNATKYSTPIIEVLKMQTPQYFGIETVKGLEVYIWDESGRLWCGLMPGTNRCKSQGEIDELAGIPLSSMAMILREYKDPQRRTSLYVLGTSEYWGDQSLYVYDGPLELWLQSELDLACFFVFSDELLNVIADDGYEYFTTGNTVEQDQLGFCLAEKISQQTCLIGPDRKTYCVYTIKGKDTDYLAVAEISNNMVFKELKRNK